MTTHVESTAEAVRNRVREQGGGQTWTITDFGDLKRSAVAAELSRLYRDGKLRRLRKGVYFHPKETVLGPSTADSEQLVDALLRKRNVVSVRGGRGEYHRLGLTNQVPNVITRAAERRVRLEKIKGIPVRVYERPLHKQKGITGAERTALDALREVDDVPGTKAKRVLLRMKALFRSGTLEYNRLARFAHVEPPRVRALLGAIGEDLHLEGMEGISATTLAGLRESLNPLTTYHVRHLGDALDHKENWDITAG